MPEESIRGFYAGGRFPRGFLWSQPEMLGTTQEEMAAFERGEVDASRAQQLHAALHMATKGLELIEARGHA